MADANRIAAALQYQQGMALPTPEPDSMVGRALDAAAQWGRGVQKNAGRNFLLNLMMCRSIN